jgi:hypothetical protein
MKKIILVIAAIIFLAGIIHISLAFPFDRALTLNALWFASAGLALILIACINYMVVNTEAHAATFFVFGHSANILTTILMGFILAFLPAPHVIVLFVLLILETALVIWLQISRTRRAILQ